MSPLLVGLGALSLLGTGVGVGVPMIDGSYARNMREQILADGPYNPEGDFNTNWWQNRFIDQDSLKAQWQKRRFNDALGGAQGARIMDIQRLTGNPFQLGMDPQEYINRNLGTYTVKAQEEKNRSAIDLRRQMQDLEGSSPQMKLLQQQLTDSTEITKKQLEGTQRLAEAKLRQSDNQFGLQFAELQRINRDNYNLRKDQARDRFRVDMRALDNDVLKLGLMKQQQNNEMTKHNRELEVFNQNRREDKVLALATGLSALSASFFL